MKNIILVSIDNLRYDCIGYQPDKKELEKHDVLKHLETPTLDSIAEKSLCFTQCISTATFTTSVHASILTGLYPPRHGVRAFYEKKLHNDVYSLAEILNLFGYETVLATDIPQLFYPLYLNIGFKHFFHKDDESLYKFLSDNKDKKIFLFIHFFDVHEPFMFSEYEIHPDYNKDFYEELKGIYKSCNIEMPSDIDDVHMLWRNLNEHIGKRDINILLPYYVRGVSKFDKGRFRYFINSLDKLGFLENSLMALFSDHGEGRVYEDDPDYFGHSGALYENVIRVPLILHGSESESKVITDLVSLVDVFPTLIRLALDKNPQDILPYEINGLSLISSEKRGWTYSETWQMDEKTDSFSIISSSILLQRAIRTEDKKYIVYGKPEFINENNTENLSNDDFIKGLYRCLLYRFESYDEYKKMVDLLNNGYPRDTLLKDFLNTKEYRTKEKLAVLDLQDNLRERYNLILSNLTEIPQDISECVKCIFKIEKGAVETENIFPPLNKERVGLIVERIFNEKNKRITESIAEDKHLILNLLEGFLKDAANDKPDEFINKICRIFPFLDLDEAQRGHYAELLKDGVSKIEVFNSLLISSKKLREYLTLTNDGDIIKQEMERIIEINKEMMIKEAEIESLKSELNQIKGSLTWSIGSKVIYLIDKILFPAGTKRQLFFQIIMDKLRHTPLKALEEKRACIPDSLLGISIEEISPIGFSRRVENPRVSIVIPVFNNWVYTYNCLKSIYENSPDGLYEVIIVDDTSTDHTHDMLQRIAGVTVIRNESNMGFIGSCNTGAENTRGEFILFLNNDTLVLKNWLEPLIKTMEDDYMTGIVGAKQILPDRRLLEAGIVVFKDGSSRQYGFGYDPEKPEFNYLREVDVVSGACLMIRKSLWQRVGGFDKRYNVAYYEDMDICFAVREQGYRIVYQPRSEIIHFSGITGEKTSNTRDSFEPENKIRFREKWIKNFRNHHEVSDIYKARERGKQKYLLVIMHTIPKPDQHSGFLRTFNMLRILNNNGYKITLFPDDLKKTSPYTEELQDLGIEVLYGDMDLNDYLKRNGKYFDTVLMIRPEVSSKYITSVKRYLNKSKVIYDTVDLHFLRETRRAEIEGSSEVMQEAKRLKNMELSLARKSNLVITVTENEKEALLKEIQDLNVAVIPNIHEINPLKNPFRERKDILFIGGFLHKPNVDAVIYFVKEIFPMIKEKITDIRFYIVGSNPQPELFELQSMDTIITGYVRDVKPYFEKCRLSVAPLRYGAGIKGKLTQSMSLGLPFVTTSIGAEGMELEDGENCLIADNPEEFANKVVRLYLDGRLWQGIRENAIKYVKNNFSNEALEEKLLGAFSQLSYKK